MEIKVGIPTLGIPRIKKDPSGLTRLENMLIGKDFHWQQEMSVLLPGRVEIIAGKGEDRIDEGYSLVNYINIEDYLESVVGSEMNPEAPIEFLKAHAIISRSWVAGKVLGSHPEDRNGQVNSSDCLIGWDDTSGHHGFHVCSDDHCQRYQGFRPLSSEAKEAIRSTAGLVLKDKEGKVVDARFSKCCGGITELFSTCWQNREMPGLESFEDPWCDRDRISPRVLRMVLKDYDLSTSGGYRWEEKISKKAIQENLLNKFGRDLGGIISIHTVERGPSGRIKILRIKGEKGELMLGKELWIRRLLSATHLYSSAFEIEDMGAEIHLKGRGWGHGVGLCQIGGANMAWHGASCADILRFYYPGTLVSPLSYCPWISLCETS